MVLTMGQGSLLLKMFCFFLTILFYYLSFVWLDESFYFVLNVSLSESSCSDLLTSSILCFFFNIMIIFIDFNKLNT